MTCINNTAVRAWTLPPRSQHKGYNLILTRETSAVADKAKAKLTNSVNGFLSECEEKYIQFS